MKKSNNLKKKFLKNDEHLKNLMKDPSALKMEVNIFEEVEVKCEPVIPFGEENIYKVDTYFSKRRCKIYLCSISFTFSLNVLVNYIH